jgi:hypothetical protein
LVAEAKDYWLFTVLGAADGRNPLNEPPALTREHLYTLLNRAPHAVNADDERGQHVEHRGQGALRAGRGAGEEQRVGRGRAAEQARVLRVWSFDGV